ncbi:MAG: hypothetical protein LBV42_02945 [Methanobrevibacter sp.]|jgi:hypothetical protein|nr:hypothetical protein [Methanobrevibacter sp.]
MYRKSQDLMIKERKCVGLNETTGNFHVMTAGKGRLFKYSLRTIQKSHNQ